MLLILLLVNTESVLWEEKLTSYNIYTQYLSNDQLTFVYSEHPSSEGIGHDQVLVPASGHDVAGPGAPEELGRHHWPGQPRRAGRRADGDLWLLQHGRGLQRGVVRAVLRGVSSFQLLVPANARLQERVVVGKVVVSCQQHRV